MLEGDVVLERFVAQGVLIFFFQAEDGIRDATVTGVQTCALPISMPILTCPTCGKSLNIPDGLVGKQVKCSACMAVFTAEDPGYKPLEERGEERQRREIGRASCREKGESMGDAAQRR